MYFVHGYSGYLTSQGKDNWFGNVVKGAIVRAKYQADGSLCYYVVVVPKSVMASSENVGFSIYGEYIYYVSPSADEDRSGSVQTDTLQFLRTKLDGTGTQLILSIDNTSVKYKYTPTALFIYDNSDSKLYAKDLTKKRFKKKDLGTCVAEEVSSVYFPKNESYDPEKGVTAADYVFYTKSSKASYEYSNTLYVVSPDGKVNKEVIGENTYADAKYNVSLVSSVVEDEKVTIYYTKTSYVGTSSSGTVVGTYAYRFQDAEFSFAAANEKKLTTKSLSTVFPLGYEAGVVVYGSDQNTVLYQNDEKVTTFGTLKMNTLVAVRDGYFYYVNGDNKILRFAMDDSANACFAYGTSESVMTSFTGVEYFDGYLYMIVDDEYDYVYRLKLDTISATDPDASALERIGILSAADEEKMKKAEEESEE